MPKISDEPMETKQVTLFKADLDYLRGLYSSQFGVNRAIRTIVRSFVNHSKAKANEMIDEEESSELNSMSELARSLDANGLR